MGIFARHDGEWYRVDGEHGGPIDIGGGELPGLGGWATIKGVTGNPTRYEYPADNPEWVAFEWVGDNNVNIDSITITEGVLDFLVISGGSGAGGDIASGGRLQRGMRKFSGGSVDVVACGAGTGLDRPSTRLGDVISPPVGASQSAQDTRGAGATDAATSTNRLKGYTDSITGDPVVYGTAGNNSDSWGSAGKQGCVIVRVPAEYDDTQGQGSTPASVVAAVDQAKETVKQTIKRNRKR